MTWKSDAKSVRQGYYGAYCKICEQLNIKPISYHSFTYEEYKRVKKLVL